MLVGVLHAYALVAEESDVVAHELKARAVHGSHEHERQVGGRVHGVGVVLEARELYGIRRSDVQLRLLAHGSGVERRLHVEVVGEVDIILRFGAHGTQSEQQ